MKLNVNFKFPDGCKEDYQEAHDMPALPRIGDFIQGSRPQSGRYRVAAVVFEIGDESHKCESVLIELEPLDAVNS